MSKTEFDFLYRVNSTTVLVVLAAANFVKNAPYDVWLNRVETDTGKPYGLSPKLLYKLEDIALTHAWELLEDT